MDFKGIVGEALKRGRVGKEIEGLLPGLLEMAGREARAGRWKDCLWAQRVHTLVDQKVTTSSEQVKTLALMPTARLL
jgi:hypothetical protein